MTSPWTSLLPATLTEEVDLSNTSVLIPLPSLGVITFSGPDSMRFLQGQTTTDFREVEKGRILPGAVCSLKGRVLFTFIAVPDGENVALVIPRDQIEAALAHLGKYAAFSKTRLEDASAKFALLGVAGPDTDQLLLKLKPGALDTAGGNPPGLWPIRLHTDNRCLVLASQEVLQSKWPSLATEATVATENPWWAADIHAGFATVFAGTRDLFQPQELNYHVLEAVSYNKGCYTGQEIVARLFFRGKLKQRLYRLEAHSRPATPDHAIFADGEQVGGVVMAANDAAGKTAVLAVVKNAAAREGQLTLGENGPALQVRELPYELPADKEE
jgi:folate-binding protein YgfZ